MIYENDFITDTTKTEISAAVCGEIEWNIPAEQDNSKLNSITYLESVTL